MIEDIERSIKPIKILLQSNFPIAFDEFRVMVGTFSANLRELLNQYFDNIVELEPIVIRNKKGEALRKFFVYQCQDYVLDPK